MFIQSCYDYANGREIKHIEGYLFGLARNIVHIYHRRESLLPTTHFLSDINDMQTQSIIEIVAAIITPGSDLFSLVSLAVPLYLLFELGILLSRFANRQ